MNPEKPLDTNTFVPQTLLNATPAGVQIISNVAPQLSIVSIFTVEQLAPVLKHCLELRKQVGKVDQVAIDAMMRRKDLKLV